MLTSLASKLSQLSLPSFTTFLAKTIVRNVTLDKRVSFPWSADFRDSREIASAFSAVAGDSLYVRCVAGMTGPGDCKTAMYSLKPMFQGASSPGGSVPFHFTDKWGNVFNRQELWETTEPQSVEIWKLLEVPVTDTICLWFHVDMAQGVICLNVIMSVAKSICYST